MIRRLSYVILFSMVLCIIHCIPIFAAEWSVFIPTEQAADMAYQAVALPTYTDGLNYDDDEIELINDLATASDADEVATASDSDYGIMLLSSHTPYESGSMSSTVVSYFDDIVAKLGAVHYVLFRSGQYEYRMYYGEGLEYDGTFAADFVDYIAYDSRYYTWSSGSESGFKLSCGSYLVYSDLGDYPCLDNGSIGSYLIAFTLVLWLLYQIMSKLFMPRAYKF